MTKTLFTTSFDVVLVPFPFADLSASKRRPCVVLSGAAVKGLGRFLIVAMVTSNLSGLPFPNDVMMAEPAAAGLPKASLIRLDKIVTLEEKLIVKKLGSLAPTDQAALKTQFHQLFSEIVALGKKRSR